MLKKNSNQFTSLYASDTDDDPESDTSHVGQTHGFMMGFQRTMISTAEADAMPRSLKQALKREADSKFKESWVSEMDFLEEKKVYKWARKSAVKKKRKNIMKGKVVFKKKQDAYGSLKKYKCRFDACGYDQVEGTAYDHTFAPVA